MRFGRWQEILNVSLPQNPQLMLFRTAATRYARAISFASLGDVSAAKKEANLFDAIRSSPGPRERILHNNFVSDILNVESKMMHGEIAYRERKYEPAFSHLRAAVALQDALKYDEPWAVMQPIRHALGGLLFEQGHTNDAEEVFRADLKLHPKNPWSLHGLISCLETKHKKNDVWKNYDDDELCMLKVTFFDQRALKWADFDISRPCECCGQR
jgi:tetratricopeptide (TPR) repeat protein